jgi:hypothetical protein
VKRRFYLAVLLLSALVGVPLAHAFVDPSGPLILTQLLQQFEETVRQTQVARQALEAGKQTAELAQESLAAARRAKAFIAQPDALLQGVQFEATEFARAHRDEALAALQKRALAEGLFAADRALENPTVGEWQASMQRALARSEQGLQHGMHVGVDALHRFDPHKAVHDWFAQVQQDARESFGEMSKGLLNNDWKAADNSFLSARANALASQSSAMTVHLLSALSAKVDAHLGNAQVAMSHALGVQRHVYDQLKGADVAWRARPLFAGDGSGAAR